MSAPTPNADKGLAELAAIIRQTRRATLQEAARAVCPYCRGNDPAVECWENGNLLWIHMGPQPCQAPEIHDLIAAMDKEVIHG